MSTDFLSILADDDLQLRAATAGNRAFNALRQAIVQLQLRPGSPLSEVEVARQLGVSRQPVREAFIKLAEVGLVEIRPQRGTFVKLISLAEVENARFLREAIEIAIVHQAARQATPADVQKLRSIIAEQAALDEADNLNFLRLDEAFHQTIAGLANREHAWRVLENLRAQMDRVRFLSLPDATPLDVIVDQHRRIVDAIEAGDASLADEAMRVHLHEVLNAVPKLAKQFPDLFCS